MNSGERKEETIKTTKKMANREFLNAISYQGNDGN